MCVHDAQRIKDSAVGLEKEPIPTSSISWPIFCRSWDPWKTCSKPSIHEWLTKKDNLVNDKHGEKVLAECPASLKLQHEVRHFYECHGTIYVSFYSSFSFDLERCILLMLQTTNMNAKLSNDACRYEILLTQNLCSYEPLRRIQLQHYSNQFIGWRRNIVPVTRRKPKICSPNRFKYFQFCIPQEGRQSAE